VAGAVIFGEEPGVAGAVVALEGAPLLFANLPRDPPKSKNNSEA
jgi:hypothetical protein